MLLPVNSIQRQKAKLLTANKLRNYSLILTLIALTVFSPFGTVIHLYESSPRKSSDKQHNNSFGSSASTGFATEPDNSSFMRRVAVNFTINQCFSIKESPAQFSEHLCSTTSIADYSHPKAAEICNQLPCRAPPSVI